MQMKAVQIHGPRDVRIEEIAAPALTDDGVLIRIHVCGVCPSDVRFYTGSRPGITYPRTTGHEWVGEVLEVGANVSEFRVGDRVAAFGQRVCGMCRNCQKGLFNICLNRLPAIRGGFCEIGWAVPEALVPIPDGVSYDAASFTEPLACCYNGISRTPISPGDVVAIIGVGPIGQILAQLARLRGARVVAIDFDEERLDLAKQLGAWATLKAGQPDLAEQVRDLTDGYGADAAIVAVGSPRAAESAFKIVGQGGAINLFAGTYPPTTIAVDPNVIHYKQLWVTGSFHFTPGGFRTAMGLISRGDVNLLPLVSHRLPLEEAGRAFELVATQGGMKVLVHMEGAN
ncbi:MAG TPA: zinc-binding dehydrogenase [Chloroflexi bacterium]|jgi:L-iditol 2-dehydrogenase|nr:zinc-binding dehydrogenase [Chloroflexota bacterium]